MPTRKPGLCIVVAEDEADSADTMAVLLRLWGHEVKLAQDGPTAVQMVETSQPDVLLLDIGLPRLDGYEVARRLKEQHAEKRPLIIAVTGYGQEADRRRSAECGIDLHLTKPVDPAELEQVLRRFQTVIMPSAERRLLRSAGHGRPIATLRYWSDRAVLRQCVLTMRQLSATGKEIVSQCSMTQSSQQRLCFREAWCQQAALFLEQSEKFRRLLMSFQKCGIA